jgi:hypothetical protein
MGVNDLKQLLANRKNLYLKLKQDLQALAARFVLSILREIFGLVCLVLHPGFV